MKKLTINDLVNKKMSEYAYPKSYLYKDGALSAICSLLCERGIAHAYSVTEGASVDVISLFYEENNKEFHIEWYEEKSFKCIKEEDD